jgi:hypothetical protein
MGNSGFASGAFSIWGNLKDKCKNMTLQQQKEKRVNHSRHARTYVYIYIYMILRERPNGVERECKTPIRPSSCLWFFLIIDFDLSYIPPPNVIGFLFCRQQQTKTKTTQ